MQENFLAAMFFAAYVFCAVMMVITAVAAGFGLRGLIEETFEAARTPERVLRRVGLTFLVLVGFAAYVMVLTVLGWGARWVILGLPSGFYTPPTWAWWLVASLAFVWAASRALYKSYREGERYLSIFLATPVLALALMTMSGCAPLTVVRQEVVTVKKVDGETTTTTTTTTTETPVVQLIHAPSCYSCRYPMAQVCWWEYHDRHAFEVCRPVVTPLPQVTIRGWRWYNDPPHRHPPPRRRH